MQLTTETFGNVLVAHTPDELTDDTAPNFLHALESLIAAGQINVVLQMDRSDMYDSAGLTALLDLHDLLREHGGNLKVSGLTDVGQKIFEVTRLDRRFDSFDSVIDAVSSFR
jgi:anti-sigma B factor antagonist